MPLVRIHRLPNHYKMLLCISSIYIIDVVVPPEDDDITAPGPKKRKLDVQLAGTFASSVMCLVVLANDLETNVK